MNRQTLERLTIVRAEIAEMERMRQQTIEMRSKTELLREKIEERGIEYEFQRKRSADSFLEIEACRRQLDELVC